VKPRKPRSYKHDRKLRARLRAYSLDEPGASEPFSARLARENGWTAQQAQAVIEEYKRFLYLAMTAGHRVTPSAAVDRAWLLHLADARSYRDGLCRAVLGRAVLHRPSPGGPAEVAVMEYTRTLDSYRAAFGQEPPEWIWPGPAQWLAAAPRPVPKQVQWLMDHSELLIEVPLILLGLAAVYVLGVWSGEQSGTEAAAVITVAAIVVLGALVSLSPAGRERMKRNRATRSQRAYLGLEGTFEGTTDTSRDSEGGGDWSSD